MKSKSKLKYKFTFNKQLYGDIADEAQAKLDRLHFVTQQRGDRFPKMGAISLNEAMNLVEGTWSRALDTLINYFSMSLSEVNQQKLASTKRYIGDKIAQNATSIPNLMLVVVEYAQKFESQTKKDKNRRFSIIAYQEGYNG